MARAYYFIGYVPDRRALYTRLQDAGYSLVFSVAGDAVLVVTDVAIE